MYAKKKRQEGRSGATPALSNVWQDGETNVTALIKTVKFVSMLVPGDSVV